LETFNSIDMKLSCTGWADNSNEKSHKMHCTMGVVFLRATIYVLCQYFKCRVIILMPAQSYFARRRFLQQ